MNDIIVRSLSGALFVLLMLGSFLLGTHYFTPVLFILFTLGLNEYYRLFRSDLLDKVLKSYALLAGVLMFLFLILPELGLLPLAMKWMIFPIAFLAFSLVLFSKKLSPITQLATLSFGWIYLIVPFYFLFQIADFSPNIEFSWRFIVGLFILVWTNDTFAYLSGRLFGKTKLFERISPKKTWEGTIGGFIFTVFAGLIYAYALGDDYVFWAISAVIISPCAVFGDLFESLLKRTVGVKDSGKLMPGHGGVLDRFDAVMYAAPFFFVWMLNYYA